MRSGNYNIVECNFKTSRKFFQKFTVPLKKKKKGKNAQHFKVFFFTHRSQNRPPKQFKGILKVVAKDINLLW